MSEGSTQSGRHGNLGKSINHTFAVQSSIMTMDEPLLVEIGITCRKCIPIKIITIELHELYKVAPVTRIKTSFFCFINI